MAASQTKCLSRLKGGTRPQAILEFCSRPQYKVDTLEKTPPAQHITHVLEFVNAIFAITQIGRKRNWHVAELVLQRTFPNLHGGLTRAICHGKR
jgi:hypothetical protein